MLHPNVVPGTCSVVHKLLYDMCLRTCTTLHTPEFDICVHRIYNIFSKKIIHLSCCISSISFRRTTPASTATTNSKGGTIATTVATQEI